MEKKIGNSKPIPVTASPYTTTKTTTTPQSITPMPDHLIASASQTNFSIQIWNSRTCQCVRSLYGHTAHVRSLALIKPDLLASASEDRTIRLWHWHNDGPSLCTLSGHEGNINTIEVAAHLLVSGSDDKTIQFWEWNTCVNILTLRHSDSINMLKSITEEIIGR